MSLSSGDTSSNTALGPEQTKLSFPALITLALPDTGAASICVPCCARTPRNSAEPSSEIEEHSTTMRGAPLLPLAFESNPPAPAMTAFTSAYVDTMQLSLIHI